MKNSNKTWSEAELYCMSLGGHLAKMSSAEERSFITSKMGGSSFWLGGRDGVREGPGRGKERHHLLLLKSRRKKERGGGGAVGDHRDCARTSNTSE